MAEADSSGSDGDLRALLNDTEAIATHALERVAEEPDRVLALRDAILLLLEVLAQQHTIESLTATIAVLRRIVPRSVCVLHEAGPLIQTAASKVNPILKALLSTLTVLGDRNEPVPEEICSGLVELAHLVCQTSMTAADVVQLFDFLRVSRAPVRRMILRMQTSLLGSETMPRAVFTMKGIHAGIIAPSSQAVFSKKGYSLSFGLLVNVGTTDVSLYSFRGNSGQGVSGTLEGSNLVLKMHGPNGGTQQAVVPLGELRSKMERVWAHICVVHAKKMVFKDKISVFVDGTQIFNGNLSYPDPLGMVGGQNCVGVGSAVSAGFQGRMWSPTLFGQPLNESDVQKLHWLTHWKSDLGSVTAENTGLSDKSKFIFSYDARSCDVEKRICYDVSGNDCHGWLEPGTKAFVTQGLHQVMDAVGGSACFLLLLLDQIPEMADFHPKQELSQDEIADLLAFVCLGLRSSVACRAHFLRLQGVKVLAYFIQSVSPQYLTPAVLESMTGILECILRVVTTPDDASDYIQLLLFRNTNWFLSPFDTQIKLLGDVLPSYLKILDDIRVAQTTGQKLPGMAAATSAMEALGIVTTAATTPVGVISASSSRSVDVRFFCNLLVQVYAPRLGLDDDSTENARGRKTVQQLGILRKLIIANLIDRLLFPTNPDDDLYQWRQLLAHIYRRCNQINADSYARDGEGIDVQELLSYLTGLLLSESAAQLRGSMTAKLCKLTSGTLRLWWHAMYSPAPPVRLEALKFFEAYCSDKVTLKRRDMITLVATHQAYPIDVATSDLLLDLVVGRKHVSYYGSGASSSTSSSTRSINVGRLEFLPLVLLNLCADSDFPVQSHVLFEVKVLLASPNAGQVAVEAVRSWPPWLSKLRGIIQRASSTHMRSTDEEGEDRDKHTHVMDAGELNRACMILSDEHSAASAKLDAIQAIGRSGDLRGCDFALSVFQNAEQPAAVVKAIACTVQDRFPSRCPTLVSKIAKQLIVDVLVYSILHVRNGWLHFLEFFFAHQQHPADLCSLTASIVERIIRRVSPPAKSSGSALPSHSEHTEFMWENLSQVASIVSLIPSIPPRAQDGEGGATLSRGQLQILYRKAFELWLLVLPRLHMINWDDMKSQLLQNANFSEDLAAEEKEIFCFVVAASPHARFLALQTTLQHLQFAHAANETTAALVGNVKKIIETLRLITVAVRAPSSASSATSPPHSRASFSSPPSSAGSIAEAFAAYTADVSAFFGESRSRDGKLPRELVHLYALDVLHTVTINEKCTPDNAKAVCTLVEIVVALASAALRLQSMSDADSISTTPEATKSMQIIASTDLAFYSSSEQLDQLVSLWRQHHDSQTVFCSRATMDGEIEALNAPFAKRWWRALDTCGTEFNPYLVQKNASMEADVLGKEGKACELLWRELVEDTATADAALLESTQDDERGLPSTLKQDAEKFAGSVHKLIVQSSRESRAVVDADHASGRESESSSTALDRSSEISSTGDLVQWKVNTRENGLRMRLRLKRVRDNYRLRNVSCEYADPSVYNEDRARATSLRLGPRRFRSARDSLGAGMVGAPIDCEKSWRSDAGSDYSDFIADAQMRAAIIRSCPSVGSDRDSFGGDLSDDDDDVDDDELEAVVDADDLSDDTLSYEMTDAFEKEVEEIVAVEHPPVATQSSPPIPVPSSSETSSKPSTASRTPGPSSPFGSLSVFGASLLSVVGGVTEVVSKAAKDAKDAVEFGVDSLYTARDVMTEDAQIFVHDVSSALKEGSSTHTEAGGKPTTPQSDSKRKSPGVSPPVSTAADGPELFPPSPPSGTEPSRQKKDGDPKTITRRGSIGASASTRRELEFDANLVRHMHVVAGKLVLLESHLWFIAERVIDEHETVLAERRPGVPIESAWRFLFKRRRWKIDDIASVNRRRYLLKPTALEIFIHSTRKNYFFSLSMDEIVRFHEALMTRKPVLLRRDPTMRRLRHPSSIFRNSNMSVRWMNHEISTFEYLMWLNTIAGRTYNDLTQYPVFPWVLADYESPTLDLSRASTFRDLSKPMGALEPARLKFYLDRYHGFEDADIPKFMYGTHYSNIGVVLYYLLRLEPFTSYALNVQGGKFDHADRLFHSILETWKNCLNDFNDVKELTPEWFYLPEFLKNGNNLDLGVTQSGVTLGDVVLPPWACSAEDFVLKNLMALESEFVSMNIHKWIDLIFGSSQRGPAAVEANNVYFYLTYEGMVDVDSITDPVTKSSMRAQIAHFGQTPTQVLRDPHPARLSSAPRVRRQSISEDHTGLLSPGRSSAASGLVSKSFPSSSSPDARWTLLQLPHDHPIVMVHLVPGASSMVCVDTHGQVSMHRYGTKCVKVHHTPLLNELSTTATRTLKGPGSSSAMASIIISPTGGLSPTMSGGFDAANEKSSAPSSISSEYIELHDRKSRKIIGEKRLVLFGEEGQSTVAFLNNGAVFCSVGHHDFSARFHSSSDGALLYRLLQHNSVVKCVRTSANGSLLALGAADGTISVWKVAHIASTLLDSIKIFRGAKNSRPVHANDYAADQVLLGHASSVNCLAVSDDLGICVSGSVSNECIAHDMSDGSIVQQYAVPGSSAPGVISLALSPVGQLVVQSMGLGSPVLYAFHMNGTLLAKTPLDGGRPMVSLSICMRYSKVIVSNSDAAFAYSALSLADKQVLLEKQTHGDITSQALSPDETHVVFGVGPGKVMSLSLLPHNPPLPTN